MCAVVYPYTGEEPGKKNQENQEITFFFFSTNSTNLGNISQYMAEVLLLVETWLAQNKLY